MSIDTLAYVKALEGAGVDRMTAEAHLKAMTDAVIPELVTKSDLRALEQRMDARFDNVDARFATQENKFDAKIDKLEAKLTGRIDLLEAKIDRNFEAMRGLVMQSTLAMLLGTLAIGGVLIRFLR